MNWRENQITKLATFEDRLLRRLGETPQSRERRRAHSKRFPNRFPPQAGGIYGIAGWIGCLWAALIPVESRASW